MAPQQQQQSQQFLMQAEANLQGLGRYVPTSQTGRLSAELGASRNLARSVVSASTEGVAVILVNARALMGCTDPPTRGSAQPHQCPLEVALCYGIYADERNYDDS